MEKTSTSLNEAHLKMLHARIPNRTLWKRQTYGASKMISGGQEVGDGGGDEQAERRIFRAVRLLLCMILE